MALLKAANEALKVGDVERARESSAQAIDAGADVYEAWVMHGKVLAACGDGNGAIEAYEKAVGMRADHPAAYRGLREAFSAAGDIPGLSRTLERLIEIYTATGDQEKVVEFLREAHDVVYEAKDWTRAYSTASALRAEPSAGDDVRRFALGRACEAALEIRDARARIAGQAAVDALRATTIASKADEDAARASGERAALGVDDDFTANLFDTLRAWSSADGTSVSFDARAHMAIFARLDARLNAALSITSSGALNVKTCARELLVEANSLLERFGDNVMNFVAPVALEIVSALEIGLDVEEEGWDADVDEKDVDDDVATELVRRCHAFKANAIANAWLALRDTRRSGAFAYSCRPPNPPQDAKGLLAEDVRDALIAALTANDASVGGKASLALGWLALAESMLVGGERVDMHASQASSTAIKIVAGDLDSTALPKTSRRCAIVNAEAMMRSGAFKAAASAFETLEGPRAMRGTATCAEHAHPPDYARALDVLASAAEAFPNCPRVRVELGWLLMIAGPIEQQCEALSILERACGAVTDEALSTSTPADACARLGIARWRAASAPAAKGPGSAHEALLIGAAGESAHRAAAFAHLGLVCSANGDEARARKCRTRALQLNPADPTAGPAAFADALSDGDDAHATSICRRALDIDSRCFWAANRLAPMCARANDHNGAVVALHAVLRVTPDNASAWEALGASYNALGRHSAALKAFDHALQLSDSAGEGVRAYAAAQTGFIQLALGSSTDAIEAYTKALSDGVDRVAALCGLASAHVYYAKGALRWGAPGRAAVSIGDAEDAASRALSAMGERATETAWKLLGDVRSLAARINDPNLAPDMNAMLDVRRVAAKGAVDAYEKALSLKRDGAARWRDVSAALKLHADVLRLCGDVEGARACEAKAFEYALGYVRCDPADPHAWLALAFTNDPNASVASDERKITALSRAVALDPTFADAWTALGRVYLANGEIANATRALDSARIADPSSGAAWTATAASHLARGLVDESRGAFRMAAALGAGVEADVGCALTACAAGCAKDARDAYAAARRAAECAPRDAVAAIALGLCAESRGLFDDARRAMRNAMVFSESVLVEPRSDASVTCALGADARVVRDIARLSLERLDDVIDCAADVDILSPGEDIEDAIDRLTTLVDGNPDDDASRVALARVSSRSRVHARALAGAEQCPVARATGDHRAQSARALSAAACLLNATPVIHVDNDVVNDDDNGLSTMSLGTRAMRLIARAAMFNPTDAECVRALDIARSRRQGVVIARADADADADAKDDNTQRHRALKAALAAHARGEFADAERFARDVVNDVDCPTSAASAARILLASFLLARAARDGDKNPQKEAGKVLAKIPLDDASSSVIELTRALSSSVAAG